MNALLFWAGFGLWALNSIAAAGQARFAWDPSPTPSVSYVLYAHTNAISETNLHLAVVRMSAGTNLTATALFTNAGRWHLVATARDAAGVESEPSNELVIEVPAAPASLHTVTVEHTLTLTNTWNDVGYFRLKLN